MHKNEQGRLNQRSPVLASLRYKQDLRNVQAQVDAKLRESEERFRKMADEAPMIIWMQGLHKELVYLNKAGLSFSGLLEEYYPGEMWIDHIHPDDWEALQAYESAFRMRQKFVIEYRRLDINGQYRWLLSSGWPRFLADGTFAGHIGVSLDIHHRKQAEEERRMLTERLFRAQERERSRIGRDLHDDFAQRLALLTIRLQEMENEANFPPGKILRIAELRKQADQISVDLTLFSHRLHSSFLERWGLAPAVTNQCKDISRLHQVEVTCEIEELPATVSDNVAVTLFRVLQEALHNTIKHSQATKIAVGLSGEDGILALSVVDNGIGFDPAAAQNVSTGLGLISMKERLELVGGEFAITSGPSGTQLRARVPVSEARHRLEKTGKAAARNRAA